MKIYHKTYILIIFLLSSFCLRAQTIISGVVVDKTDIPVAGVNITVNSLIITHSDIKGKFSLKFPDTTNATIICFQALSYKTKSVIVYKGQEKLKVVLLDSVKKLNGVTVKAPKYGRFSDYSSQAVKMSSFDVVTNPAANGDILGNMRVLPGVQTNDNDGRLIIQGGNPDESQIYMNDLIVLNPYGLSSKDASVRSRFSPDLFEGITLQSAGANAEFGQALSGTVHLNTLGKDKIENKTDIGLLSVGASAAILKQASSYAYRAGITYHNLTPYGKLTFSDKNEWHSYPQNFSADFFITKDFSEKTKMTTQANLSNTALNYSYYNIDSIQLNQNRKENYLLLQTNLYHTFNPKLSLSLASNFITNKITGTDIQMKNDKVDNATVWNHNKLNVQYASGRLINRTGIEYIHNPFKETYTWGQSHKINISNDLIGLYNDAKIFLHKNLSVNLGIRSEYSAYLRHFNFSPRVYVGYRLNNENIFSVSAGRYYQLPAMNYLKFSNSLGFTSVDKATVSYSYVKNKSKFQIDTYYKKYRNLVTFNEYTFYPENLSNQGKGQGWGTDIFWKSYFKSLEFWLTYSYNNTKKNYAYFEQKVTPAYLANHSFNATLKYWLKPLKSLLSSSYNVSSGTAYYNIQQPYEKTGTTPFHNRLDVSWSYLPKQNIIVHIGCTNILNTKNIYGYEYSTATEKTRAIYSPNSRFLIIGLFLTLSKSKETNQLKSL